MRADAQLNRDRILDAARDAFAVRGLDVPMAAIARRAGVGVATLYRRFPTRESLITEVFADQLAGCLSLVDDALADPDPWRGFCSAIEKVCAMQVIDRGFSAAFLTAFPDAIDFDKARTRAEEGFAAVVRRAQESGGLRADFDPADLALILQANAGITADSPAVALAASRRLVAYLLQAFHTNQAGSLPPPAPLALQHAIG
ncbi:TetR/AcrR family transcriptional regulator [Actinophytocola algeriensis]|uniref:AcrR family transcriptional regulator n=1 Tax=Actinophytocola algeriensis TaxID=1768010 RepID=A0A7W7Q4W3_9PSEU|nr:TetR/AcrR family transcriptional regulator [Actinophytocola algeriensis]MBB4906888.1 AcrR family transcriptional regulator [Actinophytocola algeriensis]MBE1478369.1 AcrR family transcriptional regulator [Actinophytocola algeriensis]